MIADCVASHIAWMRLEAAACGGEVGRAGAIDWAFVPPASTLHLLFPDDPSPADVASATELADGFGAQETAMWSARDRRLPWLRDLGFRGGWQPWWMEVDPRRVGGGSGRAALRDAVREIDAARAPLVGQPGVLFAEATEEGEPAGRAWLHIVGDIAGLYDMGVRPEFRRRGLGRDLLAVLAAEAADRDVRRITLNATPEGATLYAAVGFRMLGGGRTWWRRNPATAS